MDSSIIVIDDSDDEIEKKMAKNEEEDNVEGYTSGSDVSPVSSKSADKEDEEEPKKVVHTTTPTNSCEKPKAKKRQVEYEAVEEDENLEAEIDLIKRITDLTPKQIEYMVLRDVNYFLDIFSGECEHSWRHREYKKFSKKTGNYLYENSRLSAYTYDQYMGAVQGLQYIFCKKDFRYNEYIVKVLLPEALIKICMRIYQCSKDAAEEFLKMNFDKNPNLYPRGSAVYSPATTKTLAPSSSSSSSTSAESKSIKTSTSSSSLSTRPSASKLVVTASPKSKSKIEQFILLD